MAEIRPIALRNGVLELIDQRRLPSVETVVRCRGARETARAINRMVVRGAPAIGVTAAFGIALEAARFRKSRLLEDYDAASSLLLASRPTGVNLAWALSSLRPLTVAAAEAGMTPAQLSRRLVSQARRMLTDDVAANRAIGEHGARLIRRRGPLVTHCNAGALATAGYGTAVGVIRRAWELDSSREVYAGETRPYLQGARLTAWEFTKLGIPVTLMTDSMAGRLFQSRAIAAVVVGTDRTAANGDVANKVGTYPLAVLARRHGVPFFVAAPTSSIDLDCPHGDAIPIEERDASEVTHVAGRRVAADGVKVFNPAFDVTPAELVTAIITEQGVVRGNSATGLRRVGSRARSARAAVAKAALSS